MIEPAKDAAVLQPVRLGAAGEALRRRIDRRHLLLAIAIALLFHLLIVFGFWLVDRLRIRDIGDWSGPVLVKIGIPDAPESSAPDPGPLPEQIDTPVQPDAPVPDAPSETVEETVPEDSTPVQPESSADSTRPVEKSTTSDTSTSEARPAPEPAQARVEGAEDGTNFFIDFDGSDGEIGKAGGYEWITSYMPLPYSIDEELVKGAKKYLAMSPGFIRAEIERYWDLFRGEYIRNNIVIPPDLRPYYWSLLENSLGFHTEEADWKKYSKRPVVVQFVVMPSTTPEGSYPTDIKILSHTNDPSVDAAVMYGISRRVFYNKSDRPIIGRMTYKFEN